MASKGWNCLPQLCVHSRGCVDQHNRTTHAGPDKTPKREGLVVVPWSASAAPRTKTNLRIGRAVCVCGGAESVALTPFCVRGAGEVGLGQRGICFPFEFGEFESQSPRVYTRPWLV